MGCGNPRRFEIAQDVVRIIRDTLGVGLADLIRQMSRFVGDQVVEVAAPNRGRVCRSN